MLLIRYYAGDHIKRNETDGVVTGTGRRQLRIGFWWGNVRKTSV